MTAVWRCERLWIYLFGSKFILVTDNRTIQLIFGDPEKRPPARIERWKLWLTQFDYDIEHSGLFEESRFKHKSGTGNFAAKHKTAHKLCQVQNKCLLLSQQASATHQDPQLQLLTNWISNKKGMKLPNELKCFKQVVDEISKTDYEILLTKITASSSRRAGTYGSIGHSQNQRSDTDTSLIYRQVERSVKCCPQCQSCYWKRQLNRLNHLRCRLGPGEHWQAIFMDQCEMASIYSL